MLSFPRQFLDDLLGPDEGGDALLNVARVFLYVLLAGVVLTIFMSLVGLVAYIASQGMNLRQPITAPVWRPVGGHVLGLVALGLIFNGVMAVLAIIRSVGEKAAFTAANADRLAQIAANLFGLQALGLIAKLTDTPIRGDINGFDIDVSLSPGGMAMVLLLLILARVFRQGATMRDELEGTV